MLRAILAAFCVLATACTATGTIVSDDLSGHKDLSPVAVEDDLFLSILEGVHDTNPLDLLPPSPIIWDTCSGEENDHPCNLTGSDQRGEAFGLYANYGHPMVLDFSTGWCGPCRGAAARAQEVQDLYEDAGVIYVTVFIEATNGDVPTTKDVAQWAETYGITTSPVVASSRSILQSGGGTWALSGWPTFYYIDREMVLRDIDRGYNHEEILHSLDWLVSNF
jgi:thiol-disulfide isomerase/thioredoxin